MIKQIFSGLILGLVLTLLVAQRSEWVHHEIQTVIQDLFLENIDCHLTCKVSRVNFFWPTLELVNVAVNPLEDNDWKWNAKRYTTGFSWLNLILHRTVKLWIEIHDLDAHSTMHGTEIAILPHLQTLLSEVELDIPVDISSFVIKHATLHVEDEEADRQLELAMHAEVHALRGQKKIHFSFLSGTGIQKNIEYFNTLGGTLSCTIRDEALTSISTDCHCIVPQIDAQSPVFMTGSWDNIEGRWRIYNAENSLSIDPIVLTDREDGLWAFGRATIPVSYCLFLAGAKLSSIAPESVHGSCIVSAQGYLDQLRQLDGQITLQNVKHAHYPYALNGTITASKRDAQCEGVLALAINDAQFQSDWWYDTARDAGELVCKNQTTLPFFSTPYWHVLPQDAQVNVVRDAGKMNIAYRGVATHELLKTTEAVSGTVLVQNNKAQLQGSYNDQSYRASAQFETFPYLETATYIDAQAHSQLACAYAPASTAMQGSVQFSFIRNAIKRILNYDVQGQGNLQWDVARTSDGWEGKVHLVDGAIRLPETYNFINGIDASFTFDEKTRRLRVNDLVCQFHAGRVQCKQAVIDFDDQFKAQYMQVPLLFEQCMLNFKKDLFAMISGTASISKQKDSVPALTGHLFIERAQLKENLLSAEFQKQLFAHSGNMVASHSPDMTCDVTIETMHPIKIDTNILKTSAQVHIAIKNNFANPMVTGAVRLIGGTIEFPYKPLIITEGTMRLLPGQLHDPMIELRAKNTIKNHSVALQVTGSLSQHHIMFDSTPPLTEEQIISLLLVGSHEESLATMAPALLMQNLKHALFGINEPTVFDKYMSKIAKPLNIHLVPSFTDQTGRGGLRGALEIDVNDRWRALIQKNFSLTEDTRFELDYLLSDDITIRAIRDERRDVGGEVEVKYKF